MKHCDWEEITSIEIIPQNEYPYDYVYDFSVQDIETFATNDGIIVHNTLNTFHQCGVKNQVTQGVPRIRELISVSKKIKTPSVKIFLKDNCKYNNKLAKKIVHDLQMIHFDFFIDNTSIWYDPDIFNSVIETDVQFMHDYYNFFRDIDDTNADLFQHSLSPWVLRIELNPLYLINKNVTMFEIFYFLLQKFDKKVKLHIVYSDENSEYNVIHFRFIHKNINDCPNNDNTPITNQDYNKLLNIEQQLTCNCFFKGITEIEKTIISEQTQKYKDDDGKIKTKKEIVLETVGSNLPQILQQSKYVDATRTISNHIHEVYTTLGIEAARLTLYNEIYKVLNESGVYVNEAHVGLLTDSMTINGGLISMNRYGISKSDNGIWAMASFEEPDEHFVNACIYGQSDPMESTSANISMGQIGKFGTGLPRISFDLEKFTKYQKNPVLYPSNNENVKENNPNEISGIITFSKKINIHGDTKNQSFTKNLLKNVKKEEE